MSRSYKRTPYAGDKKHKSDKRLASKAVRRKSLTLPNRGRAYKKVFCSWNICDYCWIMTYSEFKKLYLDEVNSGEMTEKEVYNQWRKWYKRK